MKTLTLFFLALSGHLHLIAVNCAQQNITLTSTLPEDLVALPDTELVFRCVARGARILQWSSNEYISSSGHNIQILDSSSGRDVSRGEAHATLVSATVENGVPVLVSELRITVSLLYPVATIKCDDNGHGSRDNITFVLQNITLTSTLPGDNMAYLRQELVFRCVARGARILQWSSNEYISSSGHNIQILNSSSGRDVSRGDAHATLVSATVENGVPVIVSELRITVSSQYPVATIKCDDNGHGSRDNITFVLQNITLTSTLPDDNVAYLRQELVFRCVARGARILQWSSDEYISSSGHNIQILDSSSGRDVTRGEAHARLVSATEENGVPVLVSELRITVSSEYPVATIRCDDNGHGSRDNITFHVADSPPPIVSNSSLREDMLACPGDRIEFRCVTLDSHSLEWTSEIYIGPGVSLHLHVSDASPVNVPEESSGTNYAMLMNTSRETGRIRLTSTLSITVIVVENIRDQSHSVSCLNVDSGTATTVSFQLADSCESVTTGMSTESSTKSAKSTSGYVAVWIILGVFIIVVAIVVFGIILMAVYVRRQQQRGKIKPCSCIAGDKVEGQHQHQGDMKIEEISVVPPPQLQPPSTSTSSTTLTEQKSLLKSPSTVTADSKKSGQGDQNLEATSLGDILMQDTASSGTSSNIDVPVQEATGTQE